MNYLTAALRAAMIALASLCIASCGGGGEAAPAGNPSPPPDFTTSVSFSKTTVSATADTSAILGPNDDFVAFNVANPPNDGIWSRLTANGAAVVGGNVDWSSKYQGRVTVAMRSPRSLGAGSYTGTIKVELCPDAQCATQIAGSPFTITATYVVVGSADPQTVASWSVAQFNDMPFRTSQTSSPTYKLALTLQYPPYSGAYVHRKNQTGDIFASVVFGGATFTLLQLSASADYTINLKPPAVLGSGDFSGSMEFEVCYDPGCLRPVPGSAYTLQLSFPVLASEGLEYTGRSVAPPQGASEVVWSGANQKFYILSNRGATRPGLPGVDPQIAPVDPATLQVGAAVAVPGENLRRLTVTPDGTRLYVASSIKPFAYRFTVPALNNDLTVPLGSASPTDPYMVYDFAMLAGQPDSFVASLESSNRTQGIRVYDNGTPRANTIPSPTSELVYPRWLVPASTPGRFVSQYTTQTTPGTNTWDELAVHGTGINTASSTPVVNGEHLAGRPQRAGNRLFTVSGKVFDADTGALVGTFGEQGAQAAAILVDEAHGRLFDLRRGLLSSYDLTTLQRLAMAQIDVVPELGLELTLIPWGSEGVAVANMDKLVVLSGPFFSTYRGHPLQ